jgi:hypothetical protein
MPWLCIGMLLASTFYICALTNRRVTVSELNSHRRQQTSKDWAVMQGHFFMFSYKVCTVYQIIKVTPDASFQTYAQAAKWLPSGSQRDNEKMQA